MKHLFILILGLSFAPLLYAQDEYDDTQNLILDGDIRSVRLNEHLPYPVCKLRGDRLTLTFDHIGYDLKNYLYTIVHCNADWTPSALETNEYIDGYTEDRILDVESSSSTIVPYTQYRLILPNNNMGWLVSGNYVLKVFDEDDDNRLVLTRRFMVEENLTKIGPEMSAVSNSSKVFTHQEIDFAVRHDDLRISNPQKEIKAYILQNMRWDRIKGPVPPRPFSTVGNLLNFDYQDSIVFPADKEFRFFDMRSFEFRGDNIKSIGRNDDAWEVGLALDRDRYDNHSYAKTGDLNGRYAVEAKDNRGVLLATDYARVHFTLARNAEFEGADVYVYGQLSDWDLLPEFKMTYDEANHVYRCNPLLKQGYYNYQYVVIDRATGRESKTEDVEGDWHETTNFYTILVYYRPFGERYDRLLKVGGVDSATRK